MSVLTDRQIVDLNKAILGYLNAHNLKQTFDALKKETGSDFTPEPNAQYNGLLEKKWTAVIRLQKKIMDLEATNNALKEELAQAPRNRASTSNEDWIPRLPPKYSLTGHRDQITRVAFHPVYPILASASEDMTIKVWDWETGDMERSLRGHTLGVKDVDFDPSGSYLVSASADTSVRLWETEKWETHGYGGKTLHGHEHCVSAARFTPNGECIVSASRDKTVKVWSMTSLYCIKTIAAHDDWVRFVTPSEDGRFISSCSHDRTARIWDAKSGEMKSELRGHDREVEMVVFAPVATYPYIRQLSEIKDNNDEPGRFAATGARDRLVKLWDVQTGTLIATFTGHDNWIQALVFHPSGKYLLSGSDDKRIFAWDLATGRRVKSLDAHTHFVTCISWGRMLAGGGGEGQKQRLLNVMASGGTDNAVKVWTP